MKRLPCLSFAVLLLPFASPSLNAEPPVYREIVRTFLDTMIEKGTDRYGPEHSPLFAAMLDLDRMSLPDSRLPAEELAKPMPQARGHGVPDPPVGVRPTDRSPLGNNLEHDLMLLKAMFAFSDITGEQRYRDHAWRILEFWLRRCQSPATGLMHSGEHASWNFLEERGYGDIYEVFRRFPFWQELYRIDASHALRFADALWMHQIGDRRVGDFSRHARISHHRPGTGAAYPRHAGFYILAYANAYAETRDARHITRAEVLIESRTGLRPQPFSLLIEPGSWRPGQSTDPVLRASIWEAATLVPERRERWRELVRELDERAFAASRSGQVPRAEAAPAAVAAAGERVLVKERGARVITLRLGELWRMDYGSAGYSGQALLNLTRWKQTGDERFLERVREAADRYLAEGLPEDAQDLWPRAAGQVVSLLASLSREQRVDEERRRRYLEFAQRTADFAVRVLSKNGLFRADGSASHYEAITGADDLVWALLQLDCELRPCPAPPGHIDVNW